MSITTDDERRRGARGGFSAVGVTVVATQISVVILLWILAPYLKTHMAIDRDEVEEQIEEVKRRAEQR